MRGGWRNGVVTTLALGLAVWADGAPMRAAGEAAAPRPAPRVSGAQVPMEPKLDHPDIRGRLDLGRGRLRREFERTRPPLFEGPPLAPAISVSIDRTGFVWRARLPGSYAAALCRITVASSEAVTMVVGPGSGDLESSSAATIPTWYGFGDTIEEAEAWGWVPAREFAGMSLPGLFGRPGLEGKTVTLWCKIDTDSAPAGAGFRSSFEMTVCATE
jgi:hypothetical protein